MPNDYYISTDQKNLDIDLIVDFLQHKSYWANTRSRETIEKSINHSLCFGLYNHENSQIGFARVISDFAVFAWVLDVFILETYRGKGLAKLLLQEITVHPDLQGLKRWGLATKDAHGLYQQFGFTALANPVNIMEKLAT